MSKSFRFWTRCTTVATLTVLITFNPAWAGRGIRGWLKKRNADACCPAVPKADCCEPVPVCCEPVPVCEPSPECEPAPLCCDSGMTSDAPFMVVPMDSAPGVITEAHEPAIPQAAAPSPSDSAPVPPAIPTPAEADPVDLYDDPTPAEVDPAPAEVEPAPVAEPEQEFAPEPAAIEPPPADPFGEPEASPPDDLFGEPIPADPIADPFGGATEPTPADPAASDPFGGAAEPAEPEPFDPFGAAADAAPAAEAPADSFFDEVATPPADPFGGTPETPPSSDDFFNDSTPAAPATDDFFGEPVPPVTDAAPDNGLDGFFEAPPGAVDEPAAGDDFFGQPTSTETIPTNDLDDLFGTPSDDSAQLPEAEPAVDTIATVETEVATEAPEVVTANDDPQLVRNWIDNTGTFEVVGKLAVIFPDKIRLLKENGRYCTVPMRRLSDADRQMVERIANRLPAGDVKYVSTAN